MINFGGMETRQFANSYCKYCEITISNCGGARGWQRKVLRSKACILNFGTFQNLDTECNQNKLLMAV